MKKILFIGDSFTGDDNMSDEDAYYEQVRKFIDVEVFAIGGGGYGTLQELMILKKYINKINSDFFVLQFCSNDFENNSYQLEGRSIVRNQKNLRPYFIDGKIVYRDEKIYRYLYDKFNLYKFLDGRLQSIQSSMHNGYYPPQSEDIKKKVKEEMVVAVETTGQLLKMMKNSVSKKTKLLTFNCNTKNKEKTDDWIRISRRAGFIPLPMISKAVEQAEEKGVIVRAADGGHWNPTGHHIAGKALAEELTLIMKDKNDK